MIPPIYKASDSRYEAGMQYVRCGKSGVRLPAISLGLWHNFGGVNNFENSLAMAHYAFDHGVVHFDLANNYGPPYGSAEETFGLMMKKSFLPYRDEMFISSKAGYDMWEGPYGNWGSRKYLMASLDQSLRRMNLDYVDLFYSHRYDPETPLDETLQALVDIVRQGKALYVGISRWPLEAADYAFKYLKERDVPCLIYQGRYSILDREVATSGILDKACDAGVGFIGFSPLAQGLLTDRYLNGIPSDSRMAVGNHLKQDVLSEKMLATIKTLNTIAGQRGEALSDMALAWILADKRVTSVIIGASSVPQLATNLKALSSAPFTQEELEMIDAACR
ncbi:L-glyceraldehyde 3-phosphate reductase [Palleniella muris]|uniref:L-glyceraldehyde 3-phosphate reductase n=1 Tax=Palleniella muris TaxID=3038145 RepID=A0AC61QSJ0_9BACT|nr:aldo/keto reductase [Palleniella muris]TGX83171.1 L-glyceraldehyde 3-phosphate reductase [Palleniella muris]